MLKNCMYMYKKIWCYSRLRIILLFFIAFFSGLNTLADLLFYKFMIDAIQFHKPFSYVIAILAVRLGILLATQCVDNISNTVVFPFCDLKIKRGFSMELYEKVKDIDLLSFDNSKFYDKYSRAINETEYRASGMLGTLSNILTVTIQVIIVVCTLAYINPIAIIIAVVGALVTAWANVVNTKSVYNYEMNKTRLNRGFDYIKRVFYIPEYSKDIRTTHLNKIMFRKFEELTHENTDVIKKFAPKIATVAILGSWVFQFLNIGVTSAVLVGQVYKGTLGIGDFVTALYAVSTLSINLLQFSNIIPQFTEHALFINNYVEVLNYESAIKSEPNAIEVSTSEAKSISLKNVSFCYPDAPQNAIDDVSLQIKKGEKIAVVGENGAGKSTLIKLLIRLYEPDSGEIQLDNIPYSHIKKECISQTYSVVQQDFQHYALSVAENISLSSEEAEDSRISENKVNVAIEKVGLKEKMESLPLGIQTPVTKEFDENGVNFSGGQLQKMAIARMIYQDSGVMIMDEPSSALDPVSEAKIFDLIYRLAKGKTLILISHRLSGVKDMDKIVFLENGKIEEIGNHNELMKRNGKYAEMFRIQAERYGENETE